MGLSLRATRRIVAAAALVALIAEPGASLASDFAPAVGDTLGGRLVVLHSDDFAHGTSTDAYAVQAKDGTVAPVDVSLVAGVAQLVGKSVQLSVTGAQTESGLIAGSVVASGVSSTSSATAGSGKVAVVLFNFTNDPSQPWTTSSVASTVFGATSSVAAYYQDVSYGTTAITGDVFNWVTVPYDNSSCRYSTWSAAALTAAHVDANQYANVVYMFPRTDCQWAGLSTIGGKSSWINGFMTVRTIGHELGHDFGVHHASTFNCTKNGVRVTLSSTCTSVEYGDPFSIMGTGTNDLTNLERAQIGWLSDIQTITTSGYYSLAPSELSGQPRLLRVARRDGTYLYFEFRQPHGAFDNFAQSAAVVHGVTIRLAPDLSSRVQSKLLDTTPSTATFSDAPLALNRTFTDPATGVTVTTYAVSSSGATISVVWPGDSLTAPSPSPSPTSSPTPSPTPTPTPTPVASPSATPSPGATPSATPTSPPAQTSQLTAPSNLVAVHVVRRKVRITWSSGLGPVAGYRVYRNGTRIAKTIGLRVIDYLPRGKTSATYVVRAIDPKGKLGPRARFTLYL